MIVLLGKKSNERNLKNVKRFLETKFCVTDCSSSPCVFFLSSTQNS